jgi:HlyD family secretion protein
MGFRTEETIMKKVLIAVAVLAVLAAAVFGGLTFLRGSVSEAKGVPEPTQPAVKAPNLVVAEGAVAPAQSVLLGFEQGGTLAKVTVVEGQAVAAGQVLASLDDTRLRNAVSEAEANLATAEAQLLRAQAGPLQEDIMTAEAAVDVARAGVDAAQAAVAVAQTGVQDAEAAVATARANLARVQAGPAEESVAIATRRVEAAKNALFTAQSQRDIACSQPGKAACNAGQGAVQQAEEEVRIAELQLQALKRGASQQDIAVAQAQVEQAQGQVAAAQARVAQAQEQVTTAQAGVKQAEANLARAKRGPSDADLAVVRSQVEQARVAVTHAKAALADAELRAPFAGTVVVLNARAGEFIGAGQPAVQLADLEHWQIQTTDVTELTVVKVAVGAPVTITLDALPGEQFAGKVTRIKALGESRRGDITYQVTVAPDIQDPRMRWNMTAEVTIEPR